MSQPRQNHSAINLDEKCELELLREENARLQASNSELYGYIRHKVDDLLSIIGTKTLKPEDFDDLGLVEFDPLGIISNAFEHVLKNLRATNQKLHFAHDEIQTVFDTVGAAILVLNPQGCVVSYNQKTQDLLIGRDVDVTGKSCQEYICRNQTPDERCMFKKVSSKGREQHFNNWDFNGNSYNVVGRPMFDETGQLSHVVMSYSDVSARRNAETAMFLALTETQEVNAKLHGILNSVADSVLVTDATGQIVLMNRRAEELLGLCLADKRAQPQIDLLPHQELVDFLRMAPAQSQDLLVKDFSFSGASGQEHIHQARATVINTTKTGFKGCITILHEVTQEREIDRMKSDFISTAAHELRTPLTTILGYADLLLMEEEWSPVEQRNYLELIQSKAERLGDIVGDLLDISRIESGEGLDLEAKPCDLVLFCKEVLQGFHLQAAAHEFVIDIVSPTMILADRFAFLQILENVISNAVKYSPQGGIIKLSAVEKDGLCQLSVADQGLGMTSDQMERAFDKFYRADATNTAISGTGLGLTIVNLLVEAQHGLVHIASVPGQGTTVTLTFPSVCD